MILEVYADIACPWCYVGRARLKQALDQRPNLEVTLRWRPFQLQPDLPPDGRDFRSVLEEKFGSWNRAQEMFDRIHRMGEGEGLTFDVDAIDVAPNTADAHRLVLWAQDRGVGEAMAHGLFRAYFSEGRNVADRDVLVTCAGEAGLDPKATRDLLTGTEYADEVRTSQQRAQRRGITGVPCYVFGEEHAVMGAQSVDTLAEALDVAATGTAAEE
jgi:predicted DsbA family dithiol-disulfide isomerase